MTPSLSPPGEYPRPNTTRRSLRLVLGSAVCFHLAFEGSAAFWPAGLCLFGYLLGLWRLRQQASARGAFWWGTAAGAAIFVPQTTFLASLFSLPVDSWQVSPLAPVLWFLVSLWHGVFLLLLRSAERHLGIEWTWMLTPVFWMGQEYFRCETWWLRFSWLAVGGALEGPGGWWRLLGVYGVGAMAWVLLASIALLRKPQARWRYLGGTGFIASGVLLAVTSVSEKPSPPAARSVQVAGIQLEFPFAPDVPKSLDQVLLKYPATELLVLSEYTFDGPPPASILSWCRSNAKWLVVGGKEWVDSTMDSDPNHPHSQIAATSVARFRNTAFVVGPSGRIEFTQAKVQPIQFFADGLPASDQRLWESPWGPIGIAICYDASYRHVMDELVRQGARALILPTMDVREWGSHEHALNARQAALRQREYGLPVLRLASSGESILFDATGRRTASAPFSKTDDGASLAGTLTLQNMDSRRPLDAWLAPICAVGTAGWVFWWSAQVGIRRLGMRSASRRPSSEGAKRH